jgi:hypothetical protein
MGHNEEQAFFQEVVGQPLENAFTAISGNLYTIKMHSTLVSTGIAVETP